MDSLSPLRRAYYTYLARMYAFAYRAGQTSFLGLTVRGWLTLLGVGLLVAGLLLRWPGWLLLLIGLALVWLRFSFWAARRANYIRFVPDGTDLMAATAVETLTPNEKVLAQATGPFSVSGYGSSVLFRPATYWRVPLGDHIVMVEDRPNKFLYQFFSADTLQSVASGWLLYGGEPQEALAVSFLSKWGPEYTKFQAYDDGRESPTPPKLITIYLTFATDAERNRVRQTIVSDARRLRA
jgi:hypothetical protein